jgi:hypothetical protein
MKTINVNITKNGRELACGLFDRGLIADHGLWFSGTPDGSLGIAKMGAGGRGVVEQVCSLIARHSVTMRNLSEIKCGNGTHSGEWVNKNIDYLDKREEQVAFRLGGLVNLLNEYTNSVLALDFRGDPRGFVVRFSWVDDRGYVCELGVN